MRIRIGIKMWAEVRARERVNREVRSAADPHIHLDIAVTSERLDAFADAEIDVQLSTLAVLRERAADSSSTELAIVGVAIAIIVAIVAPSSGLFDVDLANDPVRLAVGILIATAIATVIAMFVLFLVLWGSSDWIVAANWQLFGWLPTKTNSICGRV